MHRPAFPKSKTAPILPDPSKVALDTSDRTDLFKYKSRPPTSPEIRLLDIELDLFSEPLHCNISHAPLDDLPDYHALSYTRADQKLVKTITCNSNRKTLSITNKLAIALRNVRLKYSPRTL